MELSSRTRYLVWLRKRQEGVSEEIKEIAWKAQQGLADAMKTGGGRQAPGEDRYGRWA